MRLLSFIKKIDWALILPAFFLTGLGLLSIYSSSISVADFLDFKKQIVFFAVCLAIVAALRLFDLRALKSNSNVVFFVYILSIITLLGLFFFGDKIRGIRGWYRLGPVSFDPVPFSAIILIIILSKYFSVRHVEIKRFQLILFSGLYALIPILFIFFQPDLGSALTLIAIWLGVIVFSGIRLRHLAILALLFSVVFTIGWKGFLRDYQKERILSFLNPQRDIQGVSWSVNQSKIAIGSGGFLGKGMGKGSQTQYGFLPEPKTDFIFSAFGEEFGFVGSAVLLFALLFLFWRLIKIAIQANDNFTRLFSSGFAFLLLSQSFINIGMCLGLFPVVGIPLPFVSYGGSQLLSFYIGLAAVMSLNKPS